MNSLTPRVWSPTQWFGGSDFGRLFRDPIFGAAWPDVGLALHDARTWPPLNVTSDDAAVHVEAEVPGVSMNELEVSVTGDKLTIAGERSSVIDGNVRTHRHERPVGKFQRVLRLPMDIDVAHVEARLENGVLTVTLPKAEALRPRRISVKASS